MVKLERELHWNIRHYLIRLNYSKSTKNKTIKKIKKKKENIKRFTRSLCDM